MGHSLKRAFKSYCVSLKENWGRKRTREKEGRSGHRIGSNSFHVEATIPYSPTATHKSLGPSASPAHLGTAGSRKHCGAFSSLKYQGSLSMKSAHNSSEVSGASQIYQRPKV